MTTEGVKVTFGNRYRDTWTGLTGVAVSRTEFAFGEPTVCLEWRANDGTVKETWVKEARLAYADGETSGAYA